MAARFIFCRRPFIVAVALGLLAFTVSAPGQEIRWQPAAATGNVICMPGSGDCGEREIILSSGGVIVTLFLEVSDWDPFGQPGDPEFWLGAFQGTVDSSTYRGGIAGNPGTVAGRDLVPVGGPGMGFEGAFQALKVCTGAPFGCGPEQDLLTKCYSAADCAVGQLCMDRCDFVYYQLDATCTVSTATINYSWSCASVDCREDPHDGTRFYGGTLLLHVPAGAKGTYNVNFYDDVNFTLFNGCSMWMLGLHLAPGQITIRTGQCCYGIAMPEEGCEDNLTAAECSLKPAPRLPIRPDGTCAENECCQCLTDSDCDDGNACTDDVCFNCTCANIIIYPYAEVCCDPATGDITVLDDGIFCTQDNCDSDTGIVNHPPVANGTACTADDAANEGNSAGICDCDFVCTDGSCLGTDLSAIACPSGDATIDCPPPDDCQDASIPCAPNKGTCDPASDYCCCGIDSDLVINVDAGPKPDENCFLLGGKVDMQISVVTGAATLTGGQFLIYYDNTCLDFQSIGACAGSIFNVSPYKIVDEAAGAIFYVSSVEPFKRCSIDGNKCFDDGDCAQDPDAQTCDLTLGAKTGDLACMSFLKFGGCDECDVCFDNYNPMNTILTDTLGNVVTILTPGACSKPVRLAGTLTVDGPAGADVHSDCGLPTTVVEWDTPSASDTCDGDRDVTCSGAYAHKVGQGSPAQDIVDALIISGGEFTQGKWLFECHASNTCGNTDQHVWTVNIRDMNALDVEVHLSQPIIAGALSRCICFELFTDCYKDAEEVCTVLAFGPPYNFKGHARDSLGVDKNNYLCVNAIDPYHTLRSSADIECVDNRWVATWKGDPLLGGNWLIGGNLDFWKSSGTTSPDTIDVLDFGKFIVEIERGARYTSGDTTCDTGAPHADINGDGLVDNIDFGIIQMNFLEGSKNSCCPDAAAAEETPITEVSIKELRVMGLAELVVADLNGDGLLNVDDLNAYQQGQGPSVRKRRGVR